MSLNEALPSKAFCLLYFATQLFDVSLKSATAEATLGSFLSIDMVVLTLLITSSVSFTYSSSPDASAGLRGIRHALERAEAVRDRNSRRRGWVVAVELVGFGVVEVADLGLMDGSDMGFEVRVSRVGEAMVVLEEEREREFWYAFSRRERNIGLFHVGLSSYLCFGFMDEKETNDL